MSNIESLSHSYVVMKTIAIVDELSHKLQRQDFLSSNGLLIGPPRAANFSTKIVCYHHNVDMPEYPRRGWRSQAAGKGSVFQMLGHVSKIVPP